MKILAALACIAVLFGLVTPLFGKDRTETDATTPVGGNDGRQKQFLERGKDKDIQLVFLGDSITDFWQTTGKKVWDENYRKYNAADFGVSGEHTEHVLGRIEHGLLDGLHPKVVVIMIGTNNIGHDNTEKSEWAAGGVKKIVETVHAKLPETKVLLLGVFPRGDKGGYDRKKVEAINEIISKLDDGPSDAEVKAESDRIWTNDFASKVVMVDAKQINLAQVQAAFMKRTAGLKEEMHRKSGGKTFYLDVGPKFLDADGALPKDVMPDKLHPNEKGYQIWAEAMKPLLEEMMR